MKKFIIPVAAALMVSGMVSAQTTQKAQKTNPSHESVAQNKPVTKSSTASLTEGHSGNTASTGTTAAANKGKHHHKKTKPVKKTTSK